MPRQLQQSRVSQQTIARCALGRTVKETSLYVFQELNRVHWAPKDLMESRVFLAGVLSFYLGVSQLSPLTPQLQHFTATSIG